MGTYIPDPNGNYAAAVRRQNRKTSKDVLKAAIKGSTVPAKSALDTANYVSAATLQLRLNNCECEAEAAELKRDRSENKDYIVALAERYAHLKRRQMTMEIK